MSTTRKPLKQPKTPKAITKLSKDPKKNAKAKKIPFAPSPERKGNEGGSDESSDEQLAPELTSATAKTSKTSKTSQATDKTTKGSKKNVREKQVPSPPSPEPETFPEDAGESEDDSGEEDVHLHGFSTDEDSSDEEDAGHEDLPAFDISTLPTIAKDDATVKRKLDLAKRRPTESRGVLFISRIPHGFYEDQMRSYFSQFGTVTRIRVSRSKKTGRSKHYGFVEFDSSSVAQIVAETMDNYLLSGHILRCKVIPKDQVHPELWVGANRKWRVVPHDRLTRIKHNKPRTEKEQARAARRLLKRQNERKRKLAEAGIQYNFDAVGYKRTKTAGA